jgi:putative transposase
MGTAQLKELKRLQKENERLRRAVSDLTLDKLILTEATRGNFKAPRIVEFALIMCEVN